MPEFSIADITACNRDVWKKLKGRNNKDVYQCLAIPKLEIALVADKGIHGHTNTHNHGERMGLLLTTKGQEDNGYNLEAGIAQQG